MATNYGYPGLGSGYDDYLRAQEQYAVDNTPGYQDWALDHTPTAQDLVSGGGLQVAGDPTGMQDPRMAAVADWQRNMPPEMAAEYKRLMAENNARESSSFNKQALLGMAAFGGLGALAGMGGLGALGSSGLGAGQTAIGAGVGAGGGTGFGSLGGLAGFGGGLGGLGGLGTVAGGGGGLLGTLGTLGSAAGGLSKLGGAIGAIGGGLLGANQKAPTDTTTRTIDPRMAAYLYGADGTSGILGGVNDLWKKQMAQGGLNDVQREGLNRQLATLRDPRYSQGFDAMRSSGLGLLGMPIAGNPYTQRG